MAPADSPDRCAVGRVDGGRVVMVTGAYPPDVCGVGDYVARLMGRAPSSWRLFVQREWSLRAVPGILLRLFRLRPAHVVIQYPTQGYGWSLVPHLLVLIGWVTRRYRSILALHEFTSLSPKARLTLALASRFAAHIVFTTQAERDRARAHRFFSSTAPASVIGILSNIPQSDAPPVFSARAIDLAYFGHIRPNKGLEDFLDVMAAVRQASGAVRIAVIGEIPDGYRAFGDMVSVRCREIGCEMIVGLDDQAVASALADIRILYLPFRDGVSARRGSVLAGLGNGALVATRVGDATPGALLPAIILCSGTTRDADILLNALRFTDECAGAMQQAGRDYITASLPRDWAHVATMYEGALTSGGSALAVKTC